MAILIGSSLLTMPWNNNDLGVAPGIAEVKISIISLILARMGQVRSPCKFTQQCDVDRVVVC
jgi:hypothetical protein